jgi:hypothetical protein
MGSAHFDLGRRPTRVAQMPPAATCAERPQEVITIGAGRGGEKVPC